MDKHSFYKKLGETIRKLREHRGEKQLSMAKKLGYADHSNYGKIERGELHIELYTFIQLCRELNISPFMLLLVSGYDVFIRDGNDDIQTFSKLIDSLMEEKERYEDSFMESLDSILTRLH